MSQLNALFVLSIICFVGCEICQDAVPDLAPYLGSKTPYRFVANKDTNREQFDGCRPVKIIGFIRHGTRTPSDDDLKRMKYYLPSLRERIVRSLEDRPPQPDLVCPKAVEELRRWEPIVEWREKWLTPEGEDEMVDLADRLRVRFPELLSSEYSPDHYFFKFTRSQRAQESARHFTVGLFGRYKISHIQFPESLEKDPILRFYKGCERWKKTVKKSPQANAEHYEFINGGEMLDTVEQVSRRLGLSYRLNYEDVSLMYTTCCFETAWHKSVKSPWCSIFSESDLEVMAYQADLKHYWRDGYGHELNYQIACPAVKHIFSFLESEDPSNASAVFYFTHSGTLLKTMAHLGLYKDPFLLTGHLPEEERSRRLWRTSYIDSFGTNLIFVAYDCKGERKVLTLHQERPVRVDGCADAGLCPMPKLASAYHNTLSDCNMYQLCSMYY